MLLFVIPMCLLLVGGLLFLSAEVERRVLSPRSMIISAVRARRGSPEIAEGLVAREFERLLRDYQRAS